MILPGLFDSNNLLGDYDIKLDTWKLTRFYFEGLYIILA